MSRLSGYVSSALVVLWVALATSGCAGAGTTGESWEVLFDGANLNQWTGLGRDNIPPGHWLIEGDTLHKVSAASAPPVAGNEPGYGGDLRSRNRYLNFEFCFEFKLSKGANSGVKYNVSESLSARIGHPSAAIGFEYQLLDDQTHPDAKAGLNGNRTVASLYDVRAAAANKPTVYPGRWYSGCVLAEGNRVSHTLNGMQVLSFDVSAADFQAQIATSKFSAIDGFANRRAGYIVLQDHFDDVWFRNMRVRSIDVAP